MAHTVTNIESFDTLPATAWCKGLPSLGANSIGGGFQRTGQYSFLQFGNAYVRLPVAYQDTGVPAAGLGIIYRSGVVRIYYQPLFVPIGATTRIVSMAVNAFGPGPWSATVEIDNLLQLSLNGVKAGLPTTLVLGGGYRMLELYNDNANGAELRIDGVPEVSVPGVTGFQNFVQLGDERVTANGFHIYDDMLVEAHRTNPALIDFPGDGRVARLLPNANGTDNAWLDGGIFNKWDSVNEINADGDVTYVHNNAAAVAQTFDLQNTAVLGIPGGEEIRALRIANNCRNSVGSPQWHYARLRSGGTVEETTATNVGAVAYDMYAAKVWQNDPNTGLPWTQAAVDAVEAGLRIANAATGRITLQETVVEYGVPFPLPVGRAKINPPTLGPPGATQINAATLGG